MSSQPPPGRIVQAPSRRRLPDQPQINDSFVAVNRLLKANEDVYWLKSPVSANGKTFAPGAMYIPAKTSTLAVLQKLATDKGLSFDAVAARPAGDAMKLKPVRIGLWDQYGGSMPSGWTRWLLEQYEFPFEVVFPKTLDAEASRAGTTCLIFVDGAIPMRDGGGSGRPSPRQHTGRVQRPAGAESPSRRTVPELKKFVEAGGTLLAIGSSTAMGYHLGLPMRNALTERVNGVERPLPDEKFFVPGSILRARVDNTNPLAYGLENTVDIFFDHSEAFRLLPGAELKA